MAQSLWRRQQSGGVRRGQGMPGWGGSVAVGCLAMVNNRTIRIWDPPLAPVGLDICSKMPWTFHGSFHAWTRLHDRQLLWSCGADAARPGQRASRLRKIIHR